MSVIISVGSIEHPNSTSSVTVEFSNAISDSEINSFITNEPSSGSTLSTMTTSDNGKTWIGTLTGTTGYVVKDATMSINYTGGITDSDTYDVVMTSDGKGWNEIFDITDGVDSYTGHTGLSINQSGTIFALDYNNTAGFDADNNKYSHVKVYEKVGNNYVQKGSDLEVSTTIARVNYVKLSASGLRIGITSDGFQATKSVTIYDWDTETNDWVQLGNTILIAGAKRVRFANNDNTMAFVTHGLGVYVYDWDAVANDWVQKGNTIAGTAGMGEVVMNLDATRYTILNHSYLNNRLMTYSWNSGTNNWDLIDSIQVVDSRGIYGNLAGDRIVYNYRDVNGEIDGLQGIKAYEWNGTTWNQMGTSLKMGPENWGIEIGRMNDVGDKIVFTIGQYTKTYVYSYDGTDWSEDIEIDYGNKCNINGSGDIIIMSNGYTDKSVSVQENVIVKQLNKISMTPSEVKFPESSSELKLEFSHSDLTSTEVGTNVSISDVNLGSLGGFTSSEGGYVWKSTFTGANIEGSGTIDYSYSGMTGSVALIVDTLEKAISNICFRGEAKVLTSEGYKEIRDVKKGIKIQGEEIEEVTRTISKESEVVLMKKGSIMKKMPIEDTVITKEHKVLYKGRMVEAKELVNGRTIVYEKYKGETLYNIMLSGEGKMVVNGMIVETLSPSNNIAKLYKMLKGYKEEEKVEIIKIYNEERNKKKR